MVKICGVFLQVFETKAWYASQILCSLLLSWVSIVVQNVAALLLGKFGICRSLGNRTKSSFNFGLKIVYDIFLIKCWKYQPKNHGIFNKLESHDIYHGFDQIST